MMIEKWPSASTVIRPFGSVPNGADAAPSPLSDTSVQVPTMRSRVDASPIAAFPPVARMVTAANAAQIELLFMSFLRQAAG
jgi:hypothetical protein